MKTISALLALGLAPCFAQSNNKFFNDSITYMDHLKTCSPHTLTFKDMPMPGLSGKTVIKGKVGTKCVVNTSYVGSKMTADCQYTAETIKLMTSEKKYAEMRAHKLQMSSNDPIAARTMQECTMSGM